MIAEILSKVLVPSLRALEGLLPRVQSLADNWPVVTGWLQRLTEGDFAILAGYKAGEETPLWGTFRSLCQDVMKTPLFSENKVMNDKDDEYLNLIRNDVPSVHEVNILQQNIVRLRSNAGHDSLGSKAYGFFWDICSRNPKHRWPAIARQL